MMILLIVYVHGQAKNKDESKLHKLLCRWNHSERAAGHLAMVKIK